MMKGRTMNGQFALRMLAAAVIYLVLFLLGSTSGLLGPVVYAYAGTFLPLLFAFVYLYVAANIRIFGAALLLNGFALVVGILAGEGNPTFIFGLILLTVVAGIIREVCGYDTKKGVRLSFIPMAFSFYAYSGHWWTETEESLAAAVEEMSPAYADAMEQVIANTPMLIIMLVLTIPVAILAMRLAEKAMPKQAAKLK